MKRYLAIAWTMIRIAKPWEWTAIAATVLCAALTLFPGFFHIPRLLASVLTIPAVIGCFGIWFVFDLLRARAGYDK